MVVKGVVEMIRSVGVEVEMVVKESLLEKEEVEVIRLEGVEVEKFGLVFEDSSLYYLYLYLI